MRLPTLLFSLSVLLAPAAGAADESFHGAVQRGAAVPPAQHSFSDLYRLAVTSGAGPALPTGASGEAPLRTATAQAPAQFSVSDASEPGLGLLLLSGLAAATWVARRRLGYAL
jgi:MYXO-CTERM domain-containing protein